MRLLSSLFLAMYWGKGFTAPSDQLNLAAIGAGGKGISDIRLASVGGRERVVALCDVDFSGSASQSVAAFPAAKLYHDYRVMLDKEKDIDAVTISTPDHLHDRLRHLPCNAVFTYMCKSP
ncbi:MAG: Gfo/Idh/MocA family oxidoreductase [Saprospiraceae bacterium]